MSFFQKLCPAPFPPISCSFLEPLPGPQCCLYNLLEGQPENSWPLEREILYNIQSLQVFRPSSSMFPGTCATSASVRGPTRAGDGHTMPARSPSVGLPSKAIGLPGIMFATLGVSPAGRLGPNPYHPYKRTLGSNLHSTFMEHLVCCRLTNLFLIQLLTPTIRTLPPCRQHCSTQPIIKIP